MNNSAKNNKKLFIPETIQTSCMDCGPAALKSLLGGFGIEVSYERLREACQTDVDGTSIDSLEEITNSLGLEVEQVILPIEHLLLEESQALPAIVVVVLPNGLNHFVVIWRKHRSWIQIMDPAEGRRWVKAKQFIKEVYRHQMLVPVKDWFEWAKSDDFMLAMMARLKNLHISHDQIIKLIKACEGQDWYPLAKLDAITRMVDMLCDQSILKINEAQKTLIKLYNSKDVKIPKQFWSAGLNEDEVINNNNLDEASENLLLTGAVLIKVIAVKSKSEETEKQPISADLSRSLEEKPISITQIYKDILFKDGQLTLWVLLLLFAVAATGAVVEAILFRGIIDIIGNLGTFIERMEVMFAALAFIILNKSLILIANIDAVGVSRRLETRMRAALQRKIAILQVRYFGSRPISDMAERAHSVHKLRLLNETSRRFFQYFFEIIATSVGMIWLFPTMWWLISIAVLMGMLVPWLAMQPIEERDKRVRSYIGSLSQFYLEAMKGLTAIKTHGSQSTIMRQQESLLSSWVRGVLSYSRLFIAIEAVQIVFVLVPMSIVVLLYLDSGRTLGGLLLLVYWQLHLPYRAKQIIYSAKEYVSQKNIMRRIVEPLGAPERGDLDETIKDSNDGIKEQSVDIKFNDIWVKAGGNDILQGVNLSIKSGEHIAIIGESGAGKSTLLSLLLGWHSPYQGNILVNGNPICEELLVQLRYQTAWVDPSIHIWSNSVVENIRYGNGRIDSIDWSTLIDAADLRKLLDEMSDGLQTNLGESGGLVSGGEGQRIRLARSLGRKSIRLFLLDEPFRGLSSNQRSRLLNRVKLIAKDITTICVTHDVSETLKFSRVLVVDSGKIVEDGDPKILSKNPKSYYSKLIAAETRVREKVWGDNKWRKVKIDNGKIIQQNNAGDANDC